MLESALRLAGLLGLGLLFACALLVAHTWWGLTRPRRRGYAYAVSRGLPGDPGELDSPRAYQEMRLEATQGVPSLTLWEITGDAPNAPAIIFTHGWGQSRHSVLPRLPALARLASRVIAWDLPGHGDSGGVSRLGAGELPALKRVIEWAREQDPDALAPVVLYGYSLGAGLSLAIAAAEPGRVSRVVAEAPYRLPITPARNVLAQQGLPHGWSLALALRLARVGPADAFDRARIAAEVRCPVLVLHGSDDDIAPPEDGRAIAQASPNGKYVEIPGAGHKSLWLDPNQREACERALQEFLTERTPDDSPRPG